jgi:hypothetical protein
MLFQNWCNIFCAGKSNDVYNSNIIYDCNPSRLRGSHVNPILAKASIRSWVIRLFLPLTNWRYSCLWCLHHALKERSEFGTLQWPFCKDHAARVWKCSYQELEWESQTNPSVLSNFSRLSVRVECWPFLLRRYWYRCLISTLMVNRIMFC